MFGTCQKVSSHLAWPKGKGSFVLCEGIWNLQVCPKWLSEGLKKSKISCLIKKKPDWFPAHCEEVEIFVNLRPLNSYLVQNWRFKDFFNLLSNKLWHVFMENFLQKLKKKIQNGRFSIVFFKKISLIGLGFVE